MLLYRKRNKLGLTYTCGQVLRRWWSHWGGVSHWGCVRGVVNCRLARGVPWWWVACGGGGGGGDRGISVELDFLVRVQLAGSVSQQVVVLCGGGRRTLTQDSLGVCAWCHCWSSIYCQ